MEGRACLRESLITAWSFRIWSINSVEIASGFKGVAVMGD